jgi:acrylyl-CoA reductase (NADPH)
MPETYRAWCLHEAEGAVTARLETRDVDALRTAGGVLIRAAWAGVNYKDALAVLNRAKIVRAFPCIPGIEVTGTVEASDDARFAPGDAVIVHGFGLGADRDGGFTERLAVPADLVVKLPAALNLREAGIVGVAGYTAALAIDAMEVNGLAPGRGPVAVNGATGGVASLAIDMLAGLGYEVHAITRQADDGWLRTLGAAQVLAPPAVGRRPLEAATWAGAVDSLGGAALDGLLRTMRQDGVVAAFGNAMGNDLATSVLPLILRGVRLLGINANSPMPLRERIWSRIATDLRPRHAAQIGRTIAMANLPDACETLIAGDGRGRFVIDLQG